jgi:hypothetical protein
MSEDILRCNICNLDFKNNAYYKKHLTTQRHVERSTNENKKTFGCICGRSYSYLQSLYVHRKTCEQHQKSKKVTVQSSQQQSDIYFIEKIKLFEKELNKTKAQIAFLLGISTTNTNNNDTNTNNNDTNTNNNDTNTNNNDTNINDKQTTNNIDEQTTNKEDQTEHHCNSCNLDFKSLACYKKHLKTSRHIERISNPEIIKFSCVCGRYYSYNQSLYVHQKKCERHQQNKSLKPKPKIHVPVPSPCIKQLQKDKLVIFEKEHEVMKAQIEAMQKQIKGYEHNKNQDDDKKQDKQRKKISKGVRQKIAENQQNKCGECKQILTPFFHLDHIVGLQFGGTDEESNLMALCYECHTKKTMCENKCRKQIRDAIQTVLRENMINLKN